MSVSSISSSPSYSLVSGVDDTYFYPPMEDALGGDMIAMDAIPSTMNMDCGDIYSVNDSQSGSPGAMMTTFSIAKRPRKTRAKFSKVRTGCITCKRRHVKCDEAKPSCNRCIKWGGVCHGYEEPAGRPVASSEPKRTLSNASSRTAGDESTRSTSLKPSASPRSESSWDDAGTSPQPPTAHLAAPEIFNEDFWKNIVPSLVRRNAAVRYANLAVHALILAKQPTMDQSRLGYRNNQYGGALSFYGLALREVRQASAIQGDLRAAILCSMFFVIFEIINGDRAAADAHLFSGRKMLDEFLRVQQPPMNGPQQQRDCLRRELRNVLQYLALQYGSLLDIDFSQDIESEGSEFLEELIQGEFYSRITAGGISSTMPESTEPIWPGYEMSIGV